MAIRITSYLKRNRFGIYCFRRVIPPELRVILGTAEITRSTRTRDPREAAMLVRSWSASVDSLLRRASELKRKKSDAFTLDWTMEVKLGLDGVQEIKVDAEPGEEESVQRVLQAVVSAAKGPGAASGGQPGLRLFEVIDKYLDEEERSGHWRAQTALDVRGDFNQIKAILGDIPISHLNHETLNRLRDTLVRLPANINKRRDTRGRSIAEILALNLSPQSSVTTKKKRDRVTGFLERLHGRGLIAHNYARGKKPRNRSTSHDKFTEADLSKLFETSLYRSGEYKEAFMYWLPHLALYSGARLEELAQLHIGDIAQDVTSGIWYFDISMETTTAGSVEPVKKLKNLASQRRCPLHSKLIEAEFLDLC